MPIARVLCRGLAQTRAFGTPTHAYPLACTRTLNLRSPQITYTHHHPPVLYFSVSSFTNLPSRSVRSLYLHASRPYSTNTDTNESTGQRARSKKWIWSLLGGAVVTGLISFSLALCEPPYTFSGVVSQVDRSVRTLTTFALCAADYKWSLYNIDYADPLYRTVRSQVHSRCARRMLSLCQANKGVFVKAGQHMASLTHILPREYTDVMAVLQDQAPHVTYSDVVRVFQEDFGKSPSELFPYFEVTPIASASLAQVHHAVWINPTTGEKMEVAVKVQYPGLREMFGGDVKTFQIVMKGVTWLFPELHYEWLIPEFKKSIGMELDFENEARNAETTLHNFKGHAQFHVPSIVWPMTTPRILTMEYIHGVKINDVRGIEALGLDRKDVARLLCELFSEQIFVHGFVHSDPHPGNVMVRSKRVKWRNVPEIVLLDHGLYRRLDDKVRLDYCRLWKALVLGNTADIERYGRQLGAGEYHTYFSMMLTFRPNIARLATSVEVQREELKKMVRGAFEKVTMEAIATLLEQLPRDLLLVLRNNDILMSINKDLGNPVNRFIIMARTSIKGIHTARDQRLSLAGRVRAGGELLLFNTRLQMFAFLVWVGKALSVVRSALGTKGASKSTLDPEDLLSEVTKSGSIADYIM